MKTIRLLRSTAIRGNAYAEGTVLDVDDGDARILIDMGRAKLESVKIEPIAADVEEHAPESKPESKPRRSRGKAE